MAKITASFRESALRRGIVVKPKSDHQTPEAVQNAAFVEMLNLGFMLKANALKGMSVDALTSMLADARKVIGADRAMTPVYPGFPQQVEELSTSTLIMEQILHYWTAGAFLPNYPTVAREGLELKDMLRSAREVEVLTAAAAARKLARELTTAPLALSEDERTLLEGALELQHPTLAEITEVTKAARNGENMQTYVAAAFAVGNFSVEELMAAVAPSCSNSDQLLRVLLAVATSPTASKWEDNYKLAVGTLADRHSRAVRMEKLSRPTRRVIVETLGAHTGGFKADGLVGRQGLWRRAMRAVHPYDFTLTPEQKRAMDIIHGNVDYRTLNSQVEAAMEAADVATVVELLSKNQPGNLLRRLVAILRLVSSNDEAKKLADAVAEVGKTSTLTTLISAYNGVISANDETARVTRVAGLTNTMVERAAVKKVKANHLTLLQAALKEAMTALLKTLPAPKGEVAVLSEQAVPLVRRDAATADRVLDRGQELTPAGEGDTLRVFGHWNNDKDRSGYMDIGVVILDAEFKSLAVSTWDTYNLHREWATYSGDKCVYPGDSAAEYMDVKLAKLRKVHPTAKWVAMTVQSWSGWPMNQVDFIAGAMLRSDGKKGEVFDARTVSSAFKPTTASTQAVPYALNLETGRMVWLDTSNGAGESGVSASCDTTVGTLLYDELERPRFTMGELAELWADAHGAATTQEKVNREELLGLLG